MTENEVIKALAACNGINVCCSDCPCSLNSGDCENLGYMAIDIIKNLRRKLRKSRLKEKEALQRLSEVILDLDKEGI